MSGYICDTNPSKLGGGAPGGALKLIGGGAGVSGGTGMVGSSARGSSRIILREAFKTSNLNPCGSAYLPVLCGPFRNANNAGDPLARKNQTCGGSNQVNNIRRASTRAGSGVLAGAIANTDCGKTTTIGGLVFTTGNAPGQTPISTCNPKYVYDSSDFTRYKNLAAQNQTYNDKSFGGAGRSDTFIALKRVRTY